MDALCFEVANCDLKIEGIVARVSKRDIAAGIRTFAQRARKDGGTRLGGDQS